MKEQLISFETAKLAKEKGFNIPRNYWTGFITKFYHPRTKTLLSFGRTGRCNINELYIASTQSLLRKWLRNKYGIHINVCYKPNINKWDYDWIELNKISNAKEYLDYKKDTNQLFMNRKEHRFDSYEEALEQGLLKGLKLINNE